MPDPVIVPNPPTINQGDQIVPDTPPADTSAGTEKVNEIFDKVYPMKGGAEKPPVTITPPVSEPAPSTSEAIEPQTPPPQAPAESVPAEKKLPSFLEEALKVTPSQEQITPPPAAVEDWPEELPELKTDESRANWKKFRGEYKALKEQLKTQPKGSPVDEQTRARVEFLETQNKEMQTTLSRVGVQQNAEFQQAVIRPLNDAWNEAARIVRDSGGDPQELARAMTLTGKGQFEALDQIFEGMPESAKAEAHDAIRAYRHYEGVRQNAIANAPKTYEHLHRKELERQYQALNQQKQEMSGLFDDAVKTLRDEAKVELLRKTDDPDSKWWNEQADDIINNSRALYLENTDMRKMAIACVLAPMADAYRKLWMSERAARSKIEGQLKDRFGAEPSLSESPGNAGNLMPEGQMKEDLKKPFADVFLREFHKAQARSR